jgi:hypothetical protein
MGLNNRFLQDFCDLKRRGALDNCSEVIEIGAQQLSNAFLRADDQLSQCYSLFAKERINLGMPIDAGTVNGMEHQSEDNPSSRNFWQSIGFRYASIEFDGHRESIPIDLNRDQVPSRMRGIFGLAVNTGTTEHVANQDNAFRIIHDLCKPGGIMYHELPAGGMMTHGLITYTPKFFWHLCRENGYEPLILQVSSHNANPVPKNIRDSNLQFSGNDPILAETVVDFTIVAALRKQHDKAFVTPLDIPLEIMPSHRTVRDKIKSAAAKIGF